MIGFGYAPVTHYRPRRTDTGKGTFSVELALQGLIYGVFRSFHSGMRLAFWAGEDVRPEDVIETQPRPGFESAFYRVSGVELTPGQDTARAVLEKIERPIHPLVEES